MKNRVFGINFKAVRRIKFIYQISTEHSNYSMYFVYLIRDKKTKQLYIGYTENLKRRLTEHNNKNPELIYCEVYKNKKDAILRERNLKQRGQSIRWLKERIKYGLKE